MKERKVVSGNGGWSLYDGRLHSLSVAETVGRSLEFFPALMAGALTARSDAALSVAVPDQLLGSPVRTVKLSRVAASGSDELAEAFAAVSAREIVIDAVTLLPAAGGVGGGLTLSATGVGALAGAPAAALSAGAVVYGATTTTVGSRNAALGLSHLLFSRTEDPRGSESPQYTEGQLKHYQRQYEKHGIRSLEKSRKSITSRPLEHKRKLEKYKKSGRWTSYTEKEIRNLRG